MKSIFLCHSSTDKPFVRQLAEKLMKAGVRVWLDEAELNIGDSLLGGIGDALEAVDFIGVVLSKRSVGSEWVQRELKAALAREFAARRVIVLPILIERVEVPTFLRDKLYADFTPSADVTASFAKLLATLSGMAVADTIRLTARPLSADEDFQRDLRATLEAVRATRMQFPPFVDKRVLTNAVNACDFTAYAEIVAVLDFDWRAFWQGGKSAAIFSRRGMYVGGNQFNVGRRRSAFIAFEDLSVGDISDHLHEVQTGRGVLYESTVCVKGIHLSAQGGAAVAKEVVRASDLVALLVKRYQR